MKRNVACFTLQIALKETFEAVQRQGPILRDNCKHNHRKCIADEIATPRLLHPARSLATRLRIIKKLTWQPAYNLAPTFWTFAFKTMYMPM